jgi:hypothetical protein
MVLIHGWKFPDSPSVLAGLWYYLQPLFEINLPPIDDGIDDDDDEYGDFSRGYDIDEVSPSQTHPPENKKIFNMYGMEFTSSSTKQGTTIYRFRLRNVQI